MTSNNTSRSIHFSLLTAMLSGTLLAAAGPLEAQQAVTWTGSQNVAVHGSSLAKSGGCHGCDDAGAISQQAIRSGDGFAEFTVGEDWSFYVGGLSRRSDGTGFGDIDFAIRLNGNGMADVVENGQYVGGDTPYRANDVFRIEVLNGRVRYLKNGQLMHVSQRAPVYPLRLEVLLGSRNATVQNARIDTRDAGTGAVGTSGFSEAFDALDRNGDRMIRRNEWRGNRRSFNLRDVNGDGVLSRWEYLRDEPGAVGTSGQFIAVSGTDRWTDAGIYVQAGDGLTFDAEGTVQMSGNHDDVATPAGSRRRAPDAPLWQASAGALIARIGDSAPFLIGANRRMARAPMSGPLFLGVNDDHLGDNIGEYRVMVTVTPR
jgi:hypothetical protein